jgi:transcription elongation factor Elf1
MIKVKKKLAKNVPFCPACGSENLNNLFELPNKVLSSAYKIDFEQVSSIIQCNDCSLQFKDPVYDTSLDLLVYQQYSSNMKKRWNQTLPKNLISFFKRYGKGSYFLEVGPGETPISQICKDGIHYTLDIDQAHTDNTSSKSIIGSIDTPLKEEFNNLFDVVVMFDIAEHVTNVSEMFTNLNKLLKSEGKLVIETGDAFSKHAKLQGSNWKYYSIPEHRVFFSEEFIKSIAPKHGFKITHISKVPHKGVRILSGFMLKFLAYLKWKIFKKSTINKIVTSNDVIFLTPDSPIIKDHIFIELTKEDK